MTEEAYAEEFYSRLAEYEEAQGRYLTARDQLYDIIRTGVAAGLITKSKASSASGISRPTVDKLLRPQD
ncbi:hypothetical protein KNT98_gp33 [Gordonia phage Frokostdame]|uniref:Uncharacterized protein n=1 Tax=Gordonia phage Frokostdame TaxID=2250320 RepID=A0A345L323_9CAUD|nr:hypothetical protein KNT98_gp33 [Gordonia phage Frokostdame]AXH49675.1 hypothetical protein SEA_FROKOSTDAME_33 [Gordonia phage Frokostdame]